MNQPVAALYAQRGSIYHALGCDVWDAERDARGYDGPFPVVAHPPCARWSPIAVMHDDRICSLGTPERRIGNDGGCFAAALRAVREFGGVIEHPRQSSAFGDHWLGRPRRGAWQATLCGGYVTEVEQGCYGHPFHKTTWLYVHGLRGVPPAMSWQNSGKPSMLPHAHVGEVYTHVKTREHTPLPFAITLMSLARRCTGAN